MKSINNIVGANAYLILAQKAIETAKRPLKPIEMIEIAKKDGFMPSHLFGETKHKTMAARLAVHIREKSEKSVFYRTAPATFYLHSLAKDPSTPDKFKSVFIGNLRSKKIRKENVLVIPRKVLKSKIDGNFIPYEESKFQEIHSNDCHYMDRAEAELDNSVKQFVTFTLVFHKTKLLIYRRGKFTSTSEHLKGQMSIGFGGHVNDKDFTLFAGGGNALLQNAARELREELFLDEYYENQEETQDRAKLLGYINVDDSLDAEHHVAVLVAFNHKSPKLPTKGELSINQLSWLDMRKKRNDLSGFDLWSGMILRNLFQGKIELGNNMVNGFV